MIIRSIELRKIAIPRVSAFRTSLGVQSVHEGLLVRVEGENSIGWGECVAEGDPTYSPEYVSGAAGIMREFLAPSMLEYPEMKPQDVSGRLSPFRGHPMAKSALEMAVLDAQLRDWGVSFGDYLGGTRTAIQAGVSVSIADSLEDLLLEVSDHLEAGYRRIKLKIEPGWDIEPVRAVRERFGNDVLLQVDANTAYERGDERFLQRLDEFDLLMIEQPLAPDDLVGHADLAKALNTPICLDESIISAAVAAAAIRLKACSIINIKPGRVGGYLEARRIHDLAIANGVKVWCGGMAETGIGRAGNAALASLSGFSLPNDISASDRYYARDITAPFTVTDGLVVVPTGPGLGVDVKEDIVDEYTTSRETIKR
ncbi:MAG: o-succinylbenzoate synthase [Brevibacterium sp.]